MKNKFKALILIIILIPAISLMAKDITNQAGFEGWGNNPPSKEVVGTLFANYADVANTFAISTKGSKVPVREYIDTSEDLDDQIAGQITTQKGTVIKWVDDIKQITITAKNGYTIEYINDDGLPPSIIKNDGTTLTIDMLLLASYDDDFKEFGEDIGKIRFVGGIGDSLYYTVVI